MKKRTKSSKEMHDKGFGQVADYTDESLEWEKATNIDSLKPVLEQAPKKSNQVQNRRK